MQGLLRKAEYPIFCVSPTVDLPPIAINQNLNTGEEQEIYLRYLEKGLRMYYNFR